MNLFTVFTEVATEQPEWLDMLLKLWQEAGGWLKALVALVGTLPVILGALKVIDVLKKGKTNKLITTVATTVYALGNQVKELANKLEVLNENNTIEKETQRLLNEKIDKFRNETQKTQDTLATVVALTNAPVEIKKEVLKVVNDNKTKTVIENNIKHDETVVDELEIDLE